MGVRGWEWGLGVMHGLGVVENQIGGALGALGVGVSRGWGSRGGRGLMEGVRGSWGGRGVMGLGGLTVVGGDGCRGSRGRGGGSRMG